MKLRALLAASIWIGLTAWLPASDTSASHLPPAVLPEGVGINIHFTRGHERDLDLIAAAGFKFVRMDFSWSGTERKRGEYTWADYDELTANLENRGLRALYILDYSNGLYEDIITSRDPVSGKEVRAVASPAKTESVAAFARWAAAAAKHFEGRRILWEIWNEPNIGFWKPQPDVKQYQALAIATCKAVRAADPQATLLAPASSGFPWKFLEDLFQSGILRYLDGISVHPYRNYSLSPETVATDFFKLRTMIERYAPPEKRFLPVISGEWGYATHAQGISLETQAAFIVRQQLVNLHLGVPLSIWYDWKNDGTDTNYNEHNFGVVTHELMPKPSYRAIQTMGRELSGFQIARRLLPDANTWLLLLTNRAGIQKLACWITDKPQTRELPIQIASPEDVSMVDAFGASARVNRSENGSLRIELSPLPRFLTFLKSNRPLMARAALEIQGPLPSLLRGGHAAQPARLAVRVRNPFPDRIRVQLSGPDRDRITPDVPAGAFESAAIFSSLHEENRMRFPHSKILAPGQEWLVDFAFHPTRANGPAVVYVYAVFSEHSDDNHWRFLTRFAEPYRFSVSNPLLLTLAPVETGVRLGFHNPSGEAFQGQAIINNRSYPVRWQPQTFDYHIHSSLRPPEGTIKVSLTDQDHNDVVPGIERRFVPVKLETCQAHLDGDSTVPATALLSSRNASPISDQPFTRQWQLDYRFDRGWRFVRCADTAKSIVAGKPLALGLWIKGDRSGNILRTRLQDESGQTFQPDGPEITWNGWRWIEFDLNGLKEAGHWGGAN
ncbi:MAG TPA: cellulase family glycosylhydrolase, partial [Candidatus Paceibacterota bacterium]|nr:cellulase family glycosylhydrolase [Candidatus Paceibacterota bacterium]